MQPVHSIEKMRHLGCMDLTVEDEIDRNSWLLVHDPFLWTTLKPVVACLPTTRASRIHNSPSRHASLAPIVRMQANVKFQLLVPHAAEALNSAPA